MPGDRMGTPLRRHEAAERLEGEAMAVTTFQDLPLADRVQEWDGDAAERRVRARAAAEDEPNGKCRDAHVWCDVLLEDGRPGALGGPRLTHQVPGGQALR